MSKHHGQQPLLGQSAYCKRGHDQSRSDRFGRMFSTLR